MENLELQLTLPNGTTRTIRLQPGETAFFGRHARCTIQVDDPDVEPVHFRVRYVEGTGWLVEVATEAAPVRVNGQPTRHTVLAQGDIVQVGNSRIAVLSVGAAVEPVAAPPPTAPAPTPPPATPKPAPVAPPEESLLKSPLIIGSSIALVVLIAIGTYLYFWYYGRTSEALFDQAQTAMNEGRSVYARKLFDRFLQQYPDHELANLALIYRELCDVQAAQNEGNPRQALAELSDLFDRTSKLPEFRDIADEVVDTALSVALSLAEAAESTGDREDYMEARRAYEVLQERVPSAHLPEDRLKELREALDRAEAAVVKKESFEQTLAAMDEAIEQGDTETAYRARDALVLKYPDLAANESLQRRMEAAAQVDLERCTWEAVQLRPVRQDREQPAVAIAVTPVVQEAEGPPGVAFQLADGVLYAVSTQTGEPLWRRVLGRDARHLPLRVRSAGAERIAVIAPDYNELALLDPATGRLVWRLEFPEPLGPAPLFHGNKFYLSTLAGHLYQIDAGTGRVEGRLALGDQQLPLAPVPSSSGRYLYLLGEHSNIYIIDATGRELEVIGLHYLGHLRQTVQAAPLRMGRYLVVCENRRSQESTVRVLLASEDERSLEELPHDITLPGWVLSKPDSYGNLIYIATDRDTVHIFSAGAPERKEGLKAVTSARPATLVEPSGPAYAVFVDEDNLLVAGGTVRHYQVSLERQRLRPTATVDGIRGAATQPVQKVSDRVFIISWQAQDDRAIRLTAVRFTGNGFERLWETQFALGMASILRADDGWYLTTLTGHLFGVKPPEGNVTSQFVTRMLGRLEADPRSLRDAERVVLATGHIVYVPRWGATELYLRDGPRATGLRLLRLPAGVAAPPLSFAGGLLLPGTDQRIYLLDLQEARELAEPFQPPIRFDVQRQWTVLVPVADTVFLAADQTGTVFAVELREEERDGIKVRYLAAAAETTLTEAIQPPVLVMGSTLVYHTEEGDLVFASLPLLEELRRYPTGTTQGKKWLVPVPQGCVYADESGSVIAFDEAGDVRWKGGVPEALAGAPVDLGDRLACATKDGTVVSFDVNDGRVLDRRSIGEALRGDPVIVGEFLVVPGFDGTLHALPAASD